MTHLPYDICLSLRAAGLPQPEPKPGQVWYNGFIPVYVGMKSGMSHDHDPAYFCLYGGNKLIRGVEDINKMLFCPDAEYLIEHLPNGYKFHKKPDGIHFGPKEAIKSDFDVEKSITYAAALAYLHLYEKTTTPLPK